MSVREVFREYESLRDEVAELDVSGLVDGERMRIGLSVMEGNETSEVLGQAIASLRALKQRLLTVEEE